MGRGGGGGVNEISVDLIRRNLQESYFKIGQNAGACPYCPLLLIFPDWNLYLMAGALVAILNHEVTLRIEVSSKNGGAER